MGEELTPYSEMAEVLTALPLLLREARRARGLSQRAAAEQIGFTFATVSRIEAGRDGMVSNALAVLRWLDTRPSPTLDQSADGEQTGPQAANQLFNDTKEVP